MITCRCCNGRGDVLSADIGFANDTCTACGGTGVVPTPSPVPPAPRTPETPCHECGGTGCEPGRFWYDCDTCRGTGTV